LNWETLYAIAGTAAATIAIVEFFHRLRLKKESTDVEIKGAVRMRNSDEFLTVKSCEMRMQSYASKNDLTQAEQRIENRFEARFASLDSKRERDMHGLHLRIDGVSKQIDQVVGLLKGKGENL